MGAGDGHSRKTYKDYIQVWLQWDEADGLRAVDAVLENSADGYRFQIPLSWMDSLYYDFRSENDISWIDFLLRKMRIWNLKRFSHWQPLTNWFGRIWSSPTLWLCWAIILTKNKVYVADIQKQEFNGFEVTASRLISCLQIEGGERR